MGDALTVGAIGEGATRDTSEAIEAYIYRKDGVYYFWKAFPKDLLDLRFIRQGRHLC